MTKGPIEGYVQVPPVATREGDTVKLDSKAVYYKLLNQAVRDALPMAQRPL